MSSVKDGFFSREWTIKPNLGNEKLQARASTHCPTEMTIQKVHDGGKEERHDESYSEAKGYDQE